MPTYSGQCHCGALSVTFESAHEAGALPVRACGCSFCRSHGARTMTDPEGQARITVDPEALLRYRFSLGTADFLVCNRCGVYLGAYFDDGEAAYATLNVNAFEARAEFVGGGAPTDYDNEDAAGRMARRRQRWTPAILEERPK